MNTTADQLADAAFNGDLAVVRRLIGQGADINAEGRIWNPLHAAIENEQIGVVRYLIRAGADLESLCSKVQIPGTPLEHAVDLIIDSAMQQGIPIEKRSKQLIDLLVAAGAQIEPGLELERDYRCCRDRCRVEGTRLPGSLKSSPVFLNLQSILNEQDTPRPMRIATFLAVVTTTFLTALAPAMDRPAAHTKGVPVDKPAGELKPGEYWWNPALSPKGPLMILVSVPKQVMHVYRNGILIGRSTVSTGAKGHSTPGGVFTILEKKKTHRSKKYNNAPMPMMQRLTWSGIAMHSGNLPGFPASHGCIRLPYDFSKLLFAATEKGGTVVVGDGKVPTPFLAANPGLLLAPKDFTPKMAEQLPAGQYEWDPDRSKTGPITIVVSSADKMIYVYRGGNPIGRAAVEVTGWTALGEHVFTMLEGTAEEPSKLAPGHKARRWLSVKTEKAMFTDADSVASRLRLNPEFATKVDDILTPGTTVIVTEREVVRKLSNEAFFEN